MYKITLVLFGSLFVMLILGAPIFVAIGLSGIIAVFIYNIATIDMISAIVFAGCEKFLLLAIPFFILAGLIMDKAGISKRLISLIEFFVGAIPGALAIVAVLAACFFAAVSGSGPATVAALGSVLIPAMVSAGYPKDFSSSLVAISGGIGIIIPPSIALIVYGVVSQTSVTRLFIAGIIPGILIGFILIAVSFFIAYKKGYGGSGKRSFKRSKKIFIDSIWSIFMPVIILGGIYGGIFTPTEAAGVAVVWGLFVGFIIYKELTFKDMVPIIVEAATSTSVIMIIVASAGIFAWLITTQKIAAVTAGMILSVTKNRILLLLLINMIIFFCGCFLDAISIYYILTPIFLPIIQFLGIDRVMFGIIMTVNLALGQVTPPIGVNLYVASHIADLPIQKVARAVFPFMMAGLVGLLLISFIPAISGFLPDMIGIK